MNAARLFYQWGLTAVSQVVLVHSVHGLMYSVWIWQPRFQPSTRCWRGRRVTLAPGHTFWHIAAAGAGIIAASICFLSRWMSYRHFLRRGAGYRHMPLLLYNASMSGNYQVSSVIALILLAPSLFMVVIHKFMRPEMMAKLEIRLQKTKSFPSGAFCRLSSLAILITTRELIITSLIFWFCASGETVTISSKPVLSMAVNHEAAGQATRSPPDSVIAFAKLNIQ